MARKWRIQHVSLWPESDRGPEPHPFVDQFAAGAPWPMPAHVLLRVSPPGIEDYFVDVELRQDSRERFIVTGLAIRRGTPMKAKQIGKREDPEWPEGVEPQPLSVRDARRLPLSACVEAALASVARGLDDPDYYDAIVRAFVPRGRPDRGSTLFYREIAESYRDFASRGQRPAREIARRKRVTENLVHQWIHRARELGFLEPSSRRPRKQKEEK